MRARYVYSACIVIETDDVRICCDPWFTPGIYDGSWYQYPPLDGDPVSIIGPVDAIYISHIHPDHYDSDFLRRYLTAYPETRLLIGETEPQYLARKMKIDGFVPEVVSQVRIGATTATIIPNHGYFGIDNIDTAIVIERDGQSVVNMNDNPIDAKQIALVLAACAGRPTLAFLPYSGAGPYPQTYDFDSDADRDEAIKRKREQFLAIYGAYITALDPEIAVPFAGQYFLGGRLSELNRLRGVCDACEAVARYPDRSVVLADGGAAYIDLDTRSVTESRDEPYGEREVDAYLNELDISGYDYEREIQPKPFRTLPVMPLLTSAYGRAISRSATTEPFWFCISTRPEQFYCFDTGSDSGILVRSEVDDLEPRCEIIIDERYLFGLLTRMYHWNNAEIGSHYRAHRVPDVYRSDVYGFLHFLQV